MTFTQILRLYLFPVLFILLVCMVLLMASQSAIANPGRTIVIHNNTNATVTVSDYSGRIFGEIPPVSKKSFFNHLDRGQNRLVFIARCTQNEPSFQKETWVFGHETVAKSLDLFPVNFGKQAMFDKPGCGSAKNQQGVSNQKQLPTSWEECERSKFGTFCGSWSFDHKNSSGSASWGTATAELILETFTENNVVIKRIDKSGLRATYNGTIENKVGKIKKGPVKVSGGFSFYWSNSKDKTVYNGDWEASW